MKAIPTTLKEAQSFVGIFHRHHKAPRGHRWSVGAQKNGRRVGVAVVSRPVARKTEQYMIAEVTRLCTDGTKNACSFLYGLTARICKEMGFRRIQTFILPEEDGISLKAAGWRFDGITHKASWQTRPRRRIDQPTQQKQRWVKDLNL